METSRNPVRIVKIDATSDEQTLNVQFEQEVPQAISTAGQALNFLMQGHDSFTASKPRSAFVRVSKQFVENNKLQVGSVLPQNWDAQLVVAEYVPGETITADYQAFLTKRTDTFVPRTWKDKEGNPGQQEPKRAGKDGEVLTYQGQPIYRDTYLSIFKMPKEDKLVNHDNVVVGSTPALTEETSKEGSVGNPQLP